MTRPISALAEGLFAHAASLRRVAARVGTGHAAAAYVNLDRRAFGLACQFMADFLDRSMQVTVDALAASADDLRRLSDMVEAVGTGFVDGDDEARRAVRYPMVRLPL
ncbi:MAG TPA: hypothetical protein VH561_00295 [Micromonosporaceae bacterium]|jgi:hypothetical protein